MLSKNKEYVVDIVDIGQGGVGIGKYEPERIKDIGYILKMVTDNEIIPDEFRELYETFCNTLKIRR